MKSKAVLLPALLLAGAVAVATMTTTSTSASEATSTIHSTANGCDVTFKAENKSLKNLFVVLEKSEVRTKQVVAGPWSKMDRKCPNDDWKIPSKAGTKSTTCELDLICDMQRQYKFLLEERGENGNKVLNSVWVYYPSEDSWASAGTKTIDLGNIGRHFK